MPRPQKGQSKQDFIEDYMKTRWEEGFHDQKQNAAIAYSVWKNRKKKKSGADNMKQELIALNTIAEDFEKQGNSDAGGIITEAMKKIAQYDEPPRLPTNQRATAEYLSGLSRDIVGDKAWTPDRYEQLMQERAEDDWEPDMSPEAVRRNFVSMVSGPTEMGELPLIQEMRSVADTMEIAISLFEDSGLNNPQMQARLEESLEIFQTIQAIWTMAAQKAEQGPTQQFEALQGEGVASPRPAQRPNLRSV